MITLPNEPKTLRAARFLLWDAMSIGCQLRLQILPVDLHKGSSVAQLMRVLNIAIEDVQND
jgi:hypothetical protein